MASTGNAIYPLWKQALMRENDEDKSLDQGGDDPMLGVYVSLVVLDLGYAYSESHQFYTSVTGVVGIPQLLVDATVNSNIFDGGDCVFTNVIAPPPNKIEALVLHRQNAGLNSTWRLVMYEDTGVIGLPLSTNGGNIVVNWNSQGIFAL